MHDDNRGGVSGSGRPDPAQSTQDLKTAAHDAKAAVQTAAHDVKDQIKTVGADAKDKSAEKVDAVSDGAADALRQVADQLKNAVDGLGGQQPWAGKAFQTGADGLDRVSDYLATGKFDDFTHDIQSFAKSNPAAFLAGSVALGFMMARVGKTAAHHAKDASVAPTSDELASAGASSPASPAPTSAYVTGGI